MSEVDDGPQVNEGSSAFDAHSILDNARALEDSPMIGSFDGSPDLSQRASDNGQSTVDRRMLEIVIANLNILDQKVTWLIENGQFTAQRVDGLARMLEGVQAMAASMPGGFGKRARQMMQDQQEGQQANG